MVRRIAAALVALLFGSALACGSESSSGSTDASSETPEDTGAATDGGDDGDASPDAGCVATRSETGPGPLSCGGTTCPGDGYDWACCAAAGGTKCAPRAECAPTGACSSKSTCALGETCCLRNGTTQGACGPDPCPGVVLCKTTSDCKAPEQCVADGANHVCAICP